MSESTQKKQASSAELDALVASSDTGGRNPTGPIGKLLAGVCILNITFWVFVFVVEKYLWMPLFDSTELSCLTEV